MLLIIQGIAGLLLLYYGADFLVKGGVEIAQRLHVSQLVIGLTLVAFATSAPELVVSCDAALKNSGDIAIGNVIGSNICNIALILGLCAIITPLRVNSQMFKLDVPMIIFGTILFSIVFYFSRGMNRLWGGIFFLIFIVYTFAAICFSRRNMATQKNTIQVVNCPLCLAIILVPAGIGMLVSGAKFLVGTAIWLAEFFKVPQSIIALTVVAAGTSLPELATSIVAAAKGERDIAVGNIVGSCIFNIFAILGLSSMLCPLNPTGIRIMDFIAMSIVTFIIYPIMKSDFVISRKEGIFLLTYYVIYTILVTLV